MVVFQYFFYFISNLIYWLFGFKYWVISIEIPNLIAAQKEAEERGIDEEKLERKRFCTEARYNALNWFGIIVNAVCIAWLAWKRGALDYDTAFG